jgi:hypothetical protein
MAWTGPFETKWMLLGSDVCWSVRKNREGSNGRVAGTNVLYDKYPNAISVIVNNF